MPDDNRFAGLGERLGGEPEDDEDAPAAPEDGASTDVGGGTTGSGEGGEGDGGGPAFEFGATRAKSIYVREETLAVLEDVEFEVESILRREHGVRDLTGREFHDAVVRVVADHADEVAERVREERDG